MCSCSVRRCAEHHLSYQHAGCAVACSAYILFNHLAPTKMLHPTSGGVSPPKMGHNTGMDVTAEKLENDLWVWIVQTDTGAYFQSGEHFKTKSAALKAGETFNRQAE